MSAGCWADGSPGCCTGAGFNRHVLVMGVQAELSPKLSMEIWTVMGAAGRRAKHPVLVCVGLQVQGV